MEIEPESDARQPARETRAPAAARRAPAKPVDRTLDIELDPMYAPMRPTDLPPPEAKPEAPFELSADGSMVEGGAQDLAGALPDTDPIILAPADDGPAPEFGTDGGDLAAPEEPAAEAPLAEPPVAEPPVDPELTLPPRGVASPAPAAVAPPAPVAPPSPPEPQADTEGVAAAVAAEEARFHELKCIEAVPLALDGTRLSLRNGPTLDLTRVDGIGVGAVQGLAAKPVILIDLLLNWTEISDAPLRTLRLRSDQFDPRTLFPDAGKGLDAFRALLEALLERAGATPLPDAASARGRPFKMYAELARYEREVLQVER
jgi:hypothetical protein